MSTDRSFPFPSPFPMRREGGTVDGHHVVDHSGLLGNTMETGILR
jgi:hypothetical protein